MKLVKKILMVAFALIGLVLLIGSFLPRQWNATATHVISAQKEAIFPFVSNFRTWDQWAIFDVGDPSELRTFSEGAPGPGSWQKWEGKKTGRGQLWMITADPRHGITYEGAIESTVKNAHGTIAFEPAESGTRVVWMDQGTLPPLIGGYFKSMVEKALSEHFKKSLERLEKVVQAAQATTQAGKQKR